MYKKRLYMSRSSRRLKSLIADWWSDLRFFWHMTNKGPIVLASVLGTVFVAFGILFYSLFASGADRRNLTCLALNVYFEARGETDAGQRAVAEVTLNRVASNRYPDTVCEVVYQKNWDSRRKRYVGAFSWTEFDVRSMPEGEEWQRAQQAAEVVYFRRGMPMVAGALHYHAAYIKPRWARGKKTIARIGGHVFYE